MKIQALSPSFGVNNNPKPTPRHSSAPTQKKEEYYDTFEPQNLSTRSKRKARAQQEAKNLLTHGLALLIGAAIATGGAVYVEYTEDKRELGKLDTYENSIAEVAEFVDVPEEILIQTNGINLLKEQTEMYIPAEYNALDVEIEKYKAKLEAEDLSPKDKAKYEENLASLIERRNLQDKYGVTYIDERDGTAYIYLNEPTPVEKVKSIWGIDDGVIQEYNKIDYTGVIDEENEDVTTMVSGMLTLPEDELNPLRK